jgi:hypothetical protein
MMLEESASVRSVGGHVRHRCTRSQRALAVVAVVAGLVLGLSGAAGAAGILPPGNPSANIPPSNGDFLISIDNARAEEGVGPMDVNEAQLTTLPAAQQLFIVLNEERIDRGLAPIEFMTAQLDAAAAQGAQSGADPALPSSVTGGAPVAWGGGIWAGGSGSVLESDYYWMYADGAGSDSTNESCPSAGAPACWLHRDIILHAQPSCGAQPSTLSLGAAADPAGYSGGSFAAELIASCGTPADITMTWQQAASEIAGTQTVGVASMPNGSGYWEAEANGTVGAFGTAHNYGSLTVALNAPIVGIVATPNGGGYWLVAGDGGIFSFGNARFFGSTGSLRLNKPIVGMASTPNGNGYWLVASDGGIFSYGNAGFHGSMGGRPLNQPVVGMAADPSTGGYWEVASDGGIFSFAAPFLGSTGSIRLNRPIVGMEALGNGQGYRFEAADGGVFSFGQATFDGSTGGQPLVAPIVGMAPDDMTNGYWLAAADGGIFSFGGASYMGRIESGS